MAKVCFITAIYGNYDSTCKKMVEQTIPSDFICFTDNSNILSNEWIIDTTPYHILNKSPLDNDTYINSLNNNKHTFNIAKYYKCAFQNIPRLKDYDIIIWLDGSIEIIYDKTSEYIIKNIYKHKIIAWHHEISKGDLKKEAELSNFNRYTSTFWHGQYQPYQDINKQYDEYIKEGYTNKNFKNIISNTPQFGVWITCFIGFLNKDSDVTSFLNLWFEQILKYTTQDQISFPYVCFKKNMLPLTLPNYNIHGDNPHSHTQLYIKHNHG